MSIFNIVRHIWEIIRRLRVEDGWKQKYEISTTDFNLIIIIHLLLIIHDICGD